MSLLCPTIESFNIRFDWNDVCFNEHEDEADYYNYDDSLFYEQGNT